MTQACGPCGKAVKVVSMDFEFLSRSLLPVLFTIESDLV